MIPTTADVLFTHPERDAEGVAPDAEQVGSAEDALSRAEEYLRAVLVSPLFNNSFSLVE